MLLPQCFAPAKGQEEKKYKLSGLDTKGLMLGNPQNAVEDFTRLFGAFNIFRQRHQGKPPVDASYLLSDVLDSLESYGFKDRQDARSIFYNPDTQFSDNANDRKVWSRLCKYIMSDVRPDGTPWGGPKAAGTDDVVAWTSLYVHSNFKLLAPGKGSKNPVGVYVVLWEDGKVTQVPYDQVLFAPTQDNMLSIAFPSQAGVSSDCLTYGDLEGLGGTRPRMTLGKPAPGDQADPVPDNGGPEALVALSRLSLFPTETGIDRGSLWKHFDPTEDEFSLEDVQAGSAQLGFPLNLKMLTLTDLQELGVPAVFLTADDERLVVLAQLDDHEGVLIDRGMTQIVSREALAQRYPGQALVAAGASTVSTGTPQVVAEDAVRLVPLKTPEDTVVVTVKISNTGKAPLVLQIERPTPGSEKAELSTLTVAPSKSSTLSLSLRWRPFLKVSTQETLIFLKTNDPRRPRFPLGFKLSLPAATAAP